MQGFNSSAPFSRFFEPTKYDKWLTTNEIYADFDAYLHTKCIAVASFGDIFYKPHCNKPEDPVEQLVEMVPADEHNGQPINHPIQNTKLRVPGTIQRKRKSRKLQKIPEMEQQQDTKKPPISYPGLIKMALRTSATGFLLVEDIYDIICQRYPYFTTTDINWKNSVRHALSASNSFVRKDAPNNPHRKQHRYLWGLNPFKPIKGRQKKSKEIDNTKLDVLTVPFLSEN